MALTKVVLHFLSTYVSLYFCISGDIATVCLSLSLSTCDLAETSTALRKTKSQIFTNSAVSPCFSPSLFNLLLGLKSM